MNPFDHKTLQQPSDNQFLWRYIKSERIQSMLDGELYFSPLIDFDDYYESITPLHYFLINFLKRGLPLKFDLSKQLNKLDDVESFMGQVMMWFNIYDIEKKLTLLTGITDRKEISKKLFDYCENLSQFVEPHYNYQQQHYASCWFVSDNVESALMWMSYSQPGGIAIKINFGEFKKILIRYFSQMSKKLKKEGIKDSFGGLINYKDFNHAEDWLKDINNGIPLSFFKQHYYKEENEYRLIIQRDAEFPDDKFQRLHEIFNEEIQYQIVLHPTSGPEELMELKNKIKEGKFRNISLSEMYFDKV